MKVTVFLGTKGNNFILNGKLKDLNAEVRYLQRGALALEVPKRHTYKVCR